MTVDGGRKGGGNRCRKARVLVANRRRIILPELTFHDFVEESLPAFVEHGGQVFPVCFTSIPELLLIERHPASEDAIVFRPITRKTLYQAASVATHVRWINGLDVHGVSP